MPLPLNGTELHCLYTFKLCHIGFLKEKKNVNDLDSTNKIIQMLRLSYDANVESCLINT